MVLMQAGKQDLKSGELPEVRWAAAAAALVGQLLNWQMTMACSAVTQVDYVEGL